MRRFSLSLLLMAATFSNGALSYGGQGMAAAACQSCTSECDSCSSCDPVGCRWWPTALCPGRHSKYFRWWDNHITKRHARTLARKEIKQLDSCRTCDYRLGYEQAFIDIALGSRGEVPALPPQHYWKEWARTPEGHTRTQHWFNGYAAGAARAKCLYEPYNSVLPSQTGYCNPLRGGTGGISSGELSY